ncbi:MAG: 3-keto-disaccharide hydrolase [Thermoguttaceae bacterium]
MSKSTAAFAAFLVLAAVVSGASAGEYLSGIEWAEPAVIDPGGPDKAPSDAVVLFDGKDLSAWEGGENWKVGDGAITAGPGTLRSKSQFGDCQVHIEWASASEVKGESQGRSNSGVFLMGIYEVQVLDSYQNKTYYDGQCAAIYKQHPPLVNACRKPGEWQSYDIIWKCPKFDAEGKLVSPAYVTVLHNGVLVQDHFALEGDTPFDRAPRYKAHPDKGPITLQYHNNPVQFRNIWVREIKEVEHKRVSEPKVVQH